MKAEEVQAEAEAEAEAQAQAEEEEEEDGVGVDVGVAGSYFSASILTKRVSGCDFASSVRCMSKIWQRSVALR